MVRKFVDIFVCFLIAMKNERRVIHKHQRVRRGISEVACRWRFAIHVVHRAQHPRAHEFVGRQGVGVHHRCGGRFGFGFRPLARGEQGEDRQQRYEKHAKEMAFSFR